MNRSHHAIPSFRERGQGMTEYLIVVALIAVAAIGTYTLFGQTLRQQTAGLALEVSGQDSGNAITGAQGNATAAQGAAATRKGLQNFNAGNSQPLSMRISGYFRWTRPIFGP